MYNINHAIELIEKNCELIEVNCDTITEAKIQIDNIKSEIKILKQQIEDINNKSIWCEIKEVMERIDKNPESVEIKIITKSKKECSCGKENDS